MESTQSKSVSLLFTFLDTLKHARTWNLASHWLMTIIKHIKGGNIAKGMWQVKCICRAIRATWFQYKDHVFTTPVSKLDSIILFFSTMLYTNFIFLPSMFVYKYIYMYHVSYILYMCFRDCAIVQLLHNLPCIYTTWGGTNRNHDSAPRFYCVSNILFFYHIFTATSNYKSFYIFLPCVYWVILPCFYNSSK